MSFYPGWHWWGVDSFRSYPVALRIILVGLVIGATLPVVSRKMGASIYKWLSVKSEESANLLFGYVCIALIALFVIFPSNNHILGDGYNVISNCAAGKWRSPTEPLDFLAHYGVSILAGGGDQGVVYSYRICSWIAGAAFLAGLFVYFRSKRDLLLALMAALTFGVVQFFFGYIENYTFSFVSSFLFLVSASRDLDEDRVSVVTGILFVLTLGFHFRNLVLFPAFLYLILRRYRSRHLLVACSAGFVLFMTGFILFLNREANLSHLFVPIFPSSPDSYWMFSLGHIKDVINNLLLGCPIIFGLFFIPGWIKTKGILFYLLAITGALAFLFLIDTPIGGLRDWDLFSVTAAPVLILFLKLLQQKVNDAPQESYQMLLPLLLLALIHTGGWVCLNTHKEGPYEYVREVVQEDPHYSQYFMDGYINKSWGIIVANNYADHREAARAFAVRYKAEPGDSRNTLTLIRSLLNIGDSTKAYKLIEKTWKTYEGDTYVTKQMAELLLNDRKLLGAQIVYRNILNHDDKDPAIYHNLAIIKKYMGQPDSAYYLNDVAMRMSPDVSLDAQFGFYLDAFNNGYLQIAQNGLTRIILKVNSQQQDIAKRVLAAISTNNSTAISSMREQLKAISSGAAQH